MKELSLNILDITENSLKAGATLTEISLIQEGNTLTLSITDNGSGMPEEIVRGVTDPFYTTRTTRKVGLGLPLLKLAAEQTGGGINIESRHIDTHPDDHGTRVTALFYTDHIDFTPLGHIVATLTTLIQGHPDSDFLFCHKTQDRTVELDTRELREILEDVRLNSYEVIKWIEGNLLEQYSDPDQ